MSSVTERGDQGEVRRLEKLNTINIHSGVAVTGMSRYRTDGYDYTGWVIALVHRYLSHIFFDLHTRLPVCEIARVLRNIPRENCRCDNKVARSRGARERKTRGSRNPQRANAVERWKTSQGEGGRGSRSSRRIQFSWFSPGKDGPLNDAITVADKHRNLARLFARQLASELRAVRHARIDCTSIGDSTGASMRSRLCSTEESARFLEALRASAICARLDATRTTWRGTEEAIEERIARDILPDYVLARCTRAHSAHACSSGRNCGSCCIPGTDSSLKVRRVVSAIKPRFHKRHAEREATFRRRDLTASGERKQVQISYFSLSARRTTTTISKDSATAAVRLILRLAELVPSFHHRGTDISRNR